MTGSPIFRTLIAALCLAALSLLLMRLTDSAPANIAGPAAQNELTQTPIPMRVRIRCSHLPTSLSLTSGNQKLADLNAPTELRWEGTVSVPIPPEGLELALTATWADGLSGDQAVTVELEPDERDSQSQTAWTDASDPTHLTAYLGYRWK